MLKNQGITKATANKKQRHKQRTQTQKQQRKKKYDLTWGTPNTVPETQFQETCDPESITLPMPFGLIWTPKESAVHCELPYSKILIKQNPPWWTKVKAHPGPWPSNQAQCSWANEVGTRAGRQSVAAAVARQQEIQRRCKRFTGMCVLETDSAWNGKVGNEKITCERIFCEAVMPCSQWQYWS